MAPPPPGDRIGARLSDQPTAIGRRGGPPSWSTHPPTGRWAGGAVSGRHRNQINTHDGGHGVYWADPPSGATRPTCSRSSTITAEPSPATGGALRRHRAPGGGAAPRPRRPAHPPLGLCRQRFGVRGRPAAAGLRAEPAVRRLGRDRVSPPHPLRTKATPLDRFVAGGPFAMPPPAQVHEAFLRSEQRTVTKTATVNLHGNTFEVDAAPGRAPGRVRLRPLRAHHHRDPLPGPANVPPATGIDYLALLADRHAAELAEHNPCRDVIYSGSHVRLEFVEDRRKRRVRLDVGTAGSFDLSHDFGDGGWNRVLESNLPACESRAPLVGRGISTAEQPIARLARELMGRRAGRSALRSADGLAPESGHRSSATPPRGVPPSVP